MAQENYVGCGAGGVECGGGVIAAPPVDPPDDLACPKCTLLNSRRARKCGACEAELQPAK